MAMADYDSRSPVDGPNHNHEYTDDDRPAFVSDDEEAIASGASDDEGPTERNDKPIHKQLDDFKKLVLSEPSGIIWEDVWRKFDLIDDRPGNGQSEIDDRTALHILVAEHVQSTDKDVSQALIKAIANVTKRFPGLVSRLDKGGKTPLYDAIANRQARVVRNIVKHCGSRKSTNPGKDHPLVQAVRAHCNYNGRKENALHIAFREMPKAVDKETLKTMCQHATEEAVAYADAKGFTPLHYAVRYRHSSKEQFDIIKILLRKGQATRENPLSPIKDVLDYYASVRLEKGTVRMSVFEYHMWTRKTYDQETSVAVNARNKRSGKDGDAGKSGKHNDKIRELERGAAATTVDGKRVGSAISTQVPIQSTAGANTKPTGDQGRPERLPERPSERVKDERTGKGYKDERSAPTGKGSKEKEKEDRHDANKQGSQSRPAKQGGHRPVDEQKIDTGKESAPANIGITRSNTGANAPVKPKVTAAPPSETAEEKKQRRDEWSDKVQNELKIQILRNRPFDKATTFLYGKNLNNIHIYFDYQGQATTVDPRTFKDSFKNVKFDTILKYVAFPHVVVQGWSKDPKNPMKDTEMGGRSDMLFFFEWLRGMGVKRILKVIVDDIHPEKASHSDEAIERCLKGMGVEELAWQKKDIDPDTICKIDRNADDLEEDTQSVVNWEESDDEGNPKKRVKDEEERLTDTLRTLRLWWNGDNVVLRGWSDPDGLRQLKWLHRIHLTTITSLESNERIERNIEAFKIRMKQPVKRARFEAPDAEVDEDLPQGKHVTWTNIGQPAGNKIHNSSQEQELSVRPSHRWLNSTDVFGVKLAHVWKKLAAEREKKGDKPKDIVIALIDDGVDNTHVLLQDKIIPGRTLSSDDDRIRPWYVSEKGHGTLMATSICRVCPMAKIYPIRLHTTGAANSWQSSIDAESAIKAIDAAVDMGVDIISMSWTIKVPPDSIRERFKAAIERASTKTIPTLLFCSAADGGHMSGQHYPSALLPEAFIRVGAARADGLPYEKVGDMRDVEFIMPGVDVMPVETSPGISQEVRDRSVTGSSVAAALGSGLAAMILYCIKIAAMSGKEGVRESNLDSLHHPAAMKKAIERFGMSTSKESGGKFVEVFQKLDKKSLDLSPSTQAETARELIAGLARDFVAFLD